MVRTSQHSIKFANTGKRKEIFLFREECLRVMRLYLDFLWSNRTEWSLKSGKTYCMDVETENYDHPRMLSNVELEKRMGGVDSKLSARVKKCLLSLVLAKIGSSFEKQRKRKFMIDKIREDGGSVPISLIRKYEQNSPVKPDISKTDIELNSICVRIGSSETKKFDRWVVLKSLGMFKEIAIPIQNHRQSLKFQDSGWKLKTSILLREGSVDLRWEKEQPEIKQSGSVVGIDQGLKDVVTLSDGRRPPQKDRHGHSLMSVCEKVSRKKRGSDAFRKAQDHRENFVNWSINQIDLSGVRQVNLEKIQNIGYKRNTSRLMKAWTNTAIRDKVKDVCEIQGVLVIEQTATYRSQRCSACGIVKKSNRKGKTYECPSCGNTMDADLNASLNHEVCIPDVPFGLRSLNLNRKGFFWKSEGFYGLDGEEITVPLGTETKR